MIRKLVITVTRIVASGRSKDLARLMCHRKEPQTFGVQYGTTNKEDVKDNYKIKNVCSFFAQHVVPHLTVAVPVDIYHH